MNKIISKRKQLNKKIILDRFKKIKNIKSNAELASYLGISASALSNWYRRNSIDFDLLFSKCEDVDLQYLIKGDNPNIPAKEPALPYEQGKSLYERLLDEKDLQIKDKNKQILEKDNQINQLLKIINEQKK